MGASCSSMDSAAQLVAAAKAMRASTAGDGLATNTDTTVQSPRKNKKKKPTDGVDLAAVHYDTDDEEDVDYSKLPKFARELITTLNREEDDIEGDDVDPILLTKIRPQSIKYNFVRDNGTHQLFRAESLIDYMLTTRHFHDPETRIDFTDDQLKEIDILGARLGKPSVYEAKVDGAWVRAKQIEDEDAFAGVEHCCGEHVYHMLRIIERTKKTDLQQGEMELLVKCFPFYRHYVSLMFNLNQDATIVAVDQYKRYLAGPPNRPTQDRTKHLVKYCFNFIDEVNNDLWSGPIPS